MIIPTNYHNKQVDYTNAFSQAYLKEEVHIDPPCGFGGYDGISKVLRLIKGIYGIFQPPKT